MSNRDSPRNNTNRPTNARSESGAERGTRRQFLLAVGAATTLLAGCLGGDDGGNGDENSDDGNGDDVSEENGRSDDGGSEDGGTDNGGSEDGGSGDDGSDDDGNGSSDDGGSDDGGSNDGGSDDGRSDDGRSDDGRSDDGGNGDGSGDDGNGDSGGPGDAAVFFDTIRWESEFRVVGTSTQAGQSGSYEYVVSNGNTRITFESTSEGTVELYQIDQQTYIVQGDRCTVFDGGSAPGAPDDPVDPNDPETIETEDPEITELGADSIDGRPVTVYELVYPDGPTNTLYVLDSGYVRRAEYENATANFFDWGETGPIEPPDTDCTSPGP